MNGHAIAGGLILSVCHDFRLIDKKASVQLSEIDVGLPFPIAYSKLLDHLLGRDVFKNISYGTLLSAKQAREDNIVNDMYSDR
jgi:enoyl-CoA hydratase/carnithine racemase